MLQYNNCIVTNSAEWLGVAAGVRWEDCAQGAGRACVLGMQGSRGRLTCMGRAGVARSRRWGAQQTRGGARRRAAGEAQARRARATGSWQARGRGVAGARAAGALGARPGPAGPGWSFVHFDSVFGPVSTRYFFLSH